ncbi:MAG: NUDIX hydrolase [Verrucomicrobia bacterium]|nr:NUDIX hydrolase [Verrucomicrobiota bacterium]
MSDKALFLSYSDLPAQDAYRGQSEKGEIVLVQEGAPVMFANRYVTVLEDEVIFPDGKSGSYSRVFASAELQGQHGTVVVPTFENEVFLIRLFRHPVRAWSLELPRGFAEPGMSPEENALRETLEELGVEGLGAVELGIITPNTGLLATRARVYHVPLKNRPQAAANTATQAGEAISHVVAVDRSSILARSPQVPALLDEISCAFTLGALMKALAGGLLS